MQTFTQLFADEKPTDKIKELQQHAVSRNIQSTRNRLNKSQSESKNLLLVLEDSKRKSFGAKKNSDIF